MDRSGRCCRVISLTLPFDQAGPQPGGLRQNPQLVTTATGTDHLAGCQHELLASFGVNSGGFGFADDMVVLPTQSGTQWDALFHIFHDGKMWNGYSAAEHSSSGARRNGIQHWADRLVLRGVLLDVPRAKGLAHLQPGYAITHRRTSRPPSPLRDATYAAATPCSSAPAT
jgi:hypothetical protein